jgi:hypothetical protein
MTFIPPDPAESRSGREYAAMIRLTERHATGEARRRWEDGGIPLRPLEAVERISLLAGGTADRADGEPPVDQEDLAAALTLAPRARGDLDALEYALLQMARGRGLTWQQIGYGLGLGSAQAARQRHDRLAGRVDS